MLVRGGEIKNRKSLDTTAFRAVYFICIYIYIYSCVSHVFMTVHFPSPPPPPPPPPPPSLRPISTSPSLRPISTTSPSFNRGVFFVHIYICIFWCTLHSCTIRCTHNILWNSRTIFDEGVGGWGAAYIRYTYVRIYINICYYYNTIYDRVSLNALPLHRPRTLPIYIYIYRFSGKKKKTNENTVEIRYTRAYFYICILYPTKVKRVFFIYLFFFRFYALARNVSRS